MKHKAVFSRAFEAFYKPDMDEQERTEVDQYLVDRYGAKLDAAIEVAISLGAESADLEGVAMDLLVKCIERDP